MAENRKAPPEGMGRAQGSSTEAADLGRSGTTNAAELVGLTIGRGRAPHNWANGKCCHAESWAILKMGKKRGSNRSWSLMIGPKPNLK